VVIAKYGREKERESGFTGFRGRGYARVHSLDDYGAIMEFNNARYARSRLASFRGRFSLSLSLSLSLAHVVFQFLPLATSRGAPSCKYKSAGAGRGGRVRWLGSLAVN